MKNFGLFPNNTVSFPDVDKENQNKGFFDWNTSKNMRSLRKFGFEITNFRNDLHNTLKNFSKTPKTDKKSVNKLSPKIKHALSKLTNFGMKEKELIRFLPCIENMSDFDLKNLDSPQLVSIYSKEIMECLTRNESSYVVHCDFMRKQKEINGKKRAILIDWIVSVHNQFELDPETLFLTSNIIDRYIEKAPISMDNLQLLGAASMLIACKYEELMSPEVEDFSITTDDSCSPEEILEMEANILHMLDFKLMYCSPYNFFLRFAQLRNFSSYNFYFGCYLLDLCLLEHKMVSILPSLLAASAVYVIDKIKQPKEAEAIIKLTGYCEKEINWRARQMQTIYKKADLGNLKSVYEKYSKEKYLNVAQETNNGTSF